MPDRQTGSRLVCYTRSGMVEIPLGDDQAFNALLERVARLGGGMIVREDVPPEEPGADGDMRKALQEGA